MVVIGSNRDNKKIVLHFRDGHKKILTQNQFSKIVTGPPLRWQVHKTKDLTNNEYQELHRNIEAKTKIGGGKHLMELNMEILKHSLGCKKGQKIHKGRCVKKS